MSWSVSCSLPNTHSWMLLKIFESDFIVQIAFLTANKIDATLRRPPSLRCVFLSLSNLRSTEFSALSQNCILLSVSCLLDSEPSGFQTSTAPNQFVASAQCCCFQDGCHMLWPPMAALLHFKLHLQQSTHAWWLLAHSPTESKEVTHFESRHGTQFTETRITRRVLLTLESNKNHRPQRDYIQPENPRNPSNQSNLSGPSF